MLVDLDVFGLDAQLPTMGHRVARIDTEVHKHLMQLCRITRHVPQIRGNRESNLDVFGQCVGEDFYYLFDQMRRLQCYIFTFDTAREGEHLFDHLAAAHRVCVKDVEQTAAALIVKTNLQQLNGRENRREYIVQVVRNPACQCAYGFHSLGAQELRFETPLFADVADYCGE